MEKIRDYIIIGSGFGGSVSAMRLSEKGYDCLVLEKGKEYQSQDFPKSNWNLRKFIWAPLAKCFGFQQLTLFKSVFVLSGTGVGGGSLVYANTHMVPSDIFFKNKAWVKFKDWQKTLMPFYDKAKFMLGTTPNLKIERADKILQDLAEDYGKPESFKTVNVGVYFGDPEKSTDPYFNGHGPSRNGCTECAGCMVGCRFNAKNTLDKNYLYFAKKNGVKINAETKVYKIEFDGEIYSVHTRSSTKWFSKTKVYKSRGLIVSAGVLGTLDLLLKQKYKYQTLPMLSHALGENFRTNSESLCAITGNEKLNHGVAISSVFEPDEDTHIEIVKYPNGSDAMKLLGTLATPNGTSITRPIKWIYKLFTNPSKVWRTLFNGKWAENSIIFLVMQNLDNSMKMIYKPGLFNRITIKNDTTDKVPSYLESGQQAMYKYSEKINAVSQNSLMEVILNTSTTAHVLGGCPMGASKEDGVVNEKFQVHGYKNMMILDGSIIPCNLGVNPSLTITALSEYAMSFVPGKSGFNEISIEEKIKQPVQ